MRISDWSSDVCSSDLMGATLQMLSGNRFVLGFGRAVPPLFRKLGIAVLNNAGMADHVGILRRLWAGETVSYSGPAGDYPEMQLAQPCESPPPVILGAVGPKRSEEHTSELQSLMRISYAV